MAKYDGEPLLYDPAFKGPIQNHKRSCTDIPWLILFMLFFCAWVGVGIYGMKEGNLANILAPIDSKGNQCGVGSQLEDKKYLFFLDIPKCTSFTACATQVCVKQCPHKTISFAPSQMDETTFSQLKSSMVCTYDVNVQTLTYTEARQHIEIGKCASYVIKSEAVLGQCIVDEKEVLRLEEIGESGIDARQFKTTARDSRKPQEQQAQMMQELVQSRWYLVGGLLAVVLVSCMYILLLRWVVGPVVWASIAAVFGALIFVLYFCFKKYKNCKYSKSANNDSGFWIMMFIILNIVTIILFFVVIFLRSKIMMSIAMIREGGKAVTAIKSTVFFSIFPGLLQFGVIAYALVVHILLASIEESHNKSSGDSTSMTGLYCVNVLGFFWTTFFISGVCDMILASTFSTWYWTFKKRDLTFFTLTSGVVTTLRFHTGTVAFGSFIIAIIRLMRLIAAILDQKIRNLRNPIATLILCLIGYIFRYLQKFFKFISKNAYIMCAIHGTNFCTSARFAFSLLMRNIIRVYILNKVIELIFCLAKILISTGAGFAMYYLLEWTSDERLHYSHVPAIILSIATYLICTIFFNVYITAVDTLFLCYLEDCERNDGSPDKPYYMSKDLMQILGKTPKEE